MMEAVSKFGSQVPGSTHRACATCSRAKAKCVPEDSGKCTRCQRLKKVCEPALAQPRSQPRKRRTTPASRVQKSHVEKLEEKLDGIVTLLKSTQGLRPTNESPIFETVDTSSTSSRPSEYFDSGSQASHDDITGQGLLPGCTCAAGPASGCVTHYAQAGQTPDQQATIPNTHPITLCNSDLTSIKEVEFTSSQANTLLNRWRDYMAPFFPFVVVSPSLSAEDLQRDRPFLLKSILAVASRIPGQQSALGRWLVRQLADRMAINGERSLDLLLGVIIYTGWCFYGCPNIPQLTCLLSLGMALIYDLRLNRPPPSDLFSRCLFEVALHETNCNPEFPVHGMHAKSSRTLEDRRALLGMFFITSVASRFLRCKMDPLKITPYIYDCLETLQKAEDHPNDTCLTSLVRLQILVERISQGPWNTEYGIPENFGSTPPTLYVKSLQEQLKNFRGSMPPEVNMRGFMLMHFYYAEECLYEVGLSKSPMMDNLPTHDFQRLEMLYACLQSTKMFFETLFSIPETKYLCFSLATWTQVTHSIIVLQLLSNFDHPDWNLAYVRETIDFMSVLDTVIERFQKVESEIFVRTSARIACIKALVQEKMAVAAAESRPVLLSGEDADMGRTWEPVDFLDEAWLRDILGPMEF